MGGRYRRCRRNLCNKIARAPRHGIHLHFKINNKYAVKISYRDEIGEKLRALGFSGRRDRSRGTPVGDIDLSEWLKGYCAVRMHFDKTRARCRIYGSLSIVQTINELLSAELSVSAKTPQFCTNTINGETWELNFQSPKEVDLLRQWIAESAL